MSFTSNIDLIIAVRDLLKDHITDIDIYDVVFPSYSKPEDLPDKFILVKAISQYNNGNVDSNGTIEVCLYARNLKSDTSQPNLSTLKSMTDAVYPVLDNGVKYATGIRDIRQRIVNHPEIKFHYNSLVCETISIN